MFLGISISKLFRNPEFTGVPFPVIGCAPVISALTRSLVPAPQPSEPLQSPQTRTSSLSEASLQSSPAPASLFPTVRALNISTVHARSCPASKAVPESFHSHVNTSTQTHTHTCTQPYIHHTHTYTTPNPANPRHFRIPSPCSSPAQD